MKTYAKGASLLLVVIMLMTFIAPVANAESSWNLPQGQFKKVTGNSSGQFKKIMGFYDVDGTVEWARLAIDRMYARGIITGYPGDVFKPKNNVTHLEAIIMSLRVMGWEEEAKKTKIDDYINKINLSWNDAYYYVALAVEKGLIKPEELRGFNPNTPAKRYEVARYIVRALDMESEAKKHMKEKLPFKDANAIPKDAVGYVYVMLDLELMKGDNNNKFKPQDPITRAEMAVMLNRLDGSLEPEDENQLVGTIKDIDLDDLTITLQNSFGTKTYDLVEKAPVYVDGKYRSLEDLRTGDKIELVLDADKYVVFIQLIEKTDRVSTTAKGLVVDVNSSKKSVTLFTYGKYQEGFVGTLKISRIEGRHYELETERGRYVLVGDTDDLEDYVNEKIVVLGKISKDDSIYMRGSLINVKDFYPVKSKYITTFNIDSKTKITVDNKKAGLLNIKTGDYAEVKAEDELAVEVKVKTIENPVKDTVSTKGLLTEVNSTKKTITLFTHDKSSEGFVGTLKLSRVEGRHYELETERGGYVLVSDDNLDNYINKKIVVLGKAYDRTSTYMRGPIIEAEKVYPVTEKYTATFYIDGGTKITLDNKQAGFSNIKAGDYAEVKAEDELAVEIKAKTPEEPKKTIISAKGLVAEVGKKTISLVTYIKDSDEGFVGTLKENKIEGLHYELETKQGTFVLKGNIKGLKDYVGEKIAIKGELKDEISIFMRGYTIDVEEYYLLKTRDFVTFDVDDSTKITINGNKAKLSEIKAGDFAEIRADEDNFAAEIKADSCENRIKEWEKDRETMEDGKIDGKVIAIDIGKESKLTIQNEDGKITLIIDKNVKLKGLNILKDIKKGMELELSIKGEKIVKIEVED